MARKLALLALALVACVCVSRVSAHVCYFMTMPNGWDDETRMGADVMATVLSFAAATDMRVVRFGEGGDPLLSNAQYNQAVKIVGAKMAACARAQRKILINFHAQGTAKRFLRKTIVAAYHQLRALAVADAVTAATQAHGAGSAQAIAAATAAPVIPAVVFNAFSCMPEIYTDPDTLLAYWQEMAQPNPATPLTLPQLRDEFGVWLFGRTRAQIQTMQDARAANALVLQRTNEQALAQADIDNDGAAPTVAHARALAQANAALQVATQAQAAAVQALNALPAQVVNVRYAANQPVGYIADGLVVDNHGAAAPKVLISAPWNAQPLHSAAKTACYAAYPNNAANLQAAHTATTCVLRTVFDASPDANDRALYGAPALGVGPAEAHLPTRPLLMDLNVAFPDLNGHLRAVNTGAVIGHKTSARIMSRRVAANAAVPNPFGPDDVLRLPDVLAQLRANVQGKVHALRTRARVHAPAAVPAAPAAAADEDADEHAAAADDEADE